MPQHKRGPWSQTEDQFLLHLVNVHGAHNWVRISSAMQTRSPKQCRERYHQNLKPNLNHDPITPEEGVLIEQMVAEMGKRWAEIARRLRGRSDNAVKNWWNGGVNRRRRSHHQRAGDLAQVPQAHSTPSLHELQPAMVHQHPLPGYSHQPILAQPYLGQPMFHAPHVNRQRQVVLPSNSAVSRNGGTFDSPLPSPSAFSQASAEDPPSLVSDCSSVSTRSPPNGTSPVELPPIGANHAERRTSSAYATHYGLPGALMGENEYGLSLSTMKQPRPTLLGFTALHHHQSFPQPSHYLPSQPRHASPLQHASVPPHFVVPSSQAFTRNMYHVSGQHPSTQASSVQLPSISNLAASATTSSMRAGVQIDPSLGRAHTPLVPSMSTPEGSPKDKMSLSNLTH